LEKRGEKCSTNININIKTVQNDSPCIHSFLYEFTKGLHICILNCTQIGVFVSILLCWFSKEVCHTPQNMGEHTTQCSIMDTWNLYLFLYGRTYMAPNAYIE